MARRRARRRAAHRRGRPGRRAPDPVKLDRFPRRTLRGDRTIHRIHAADRSPPATRTRGRAAARHRSRRS
jgi:hypothetical protein